MNSYYPISSDGYGANGRMDLSGFKFEVIPLARPTWECGPYSAEADKKYFDEPKKPEEADKKS